MRFFSCILFFCVYVMPVSASNLPPEHESARLLLVIEESVAQGDWSLADSSLTQIADLEVDLPVPFFYYNGLVNAQLNRSGKAQHSLEHYVVNAGPSGAFYYKSLRLLTSLENKLKNTESSVEASLKEVERSEGGQTPLLKGEGRDMYIQALKALFLTDDAVEALVMQVNSLLSAHPFTGLRLNKPSEKQGLRFQIYVQGNQIVLQKTSYQNGFPSLSASRLDISGVNPFVTYQCNKKAVSCWLYHPTSLHDVWFTISYDELVADELSQAITRLIQVLQET